MKTSEAAAALNVSATALRAWEVRYGFPVPARTLGRHRIYERGEILALRRALDEGLSVSSAVEKVRSNLGIDDSQLASALRNFDADAADLAMEAALAVRRLERAVEDILLSALEDVLRRSGNAGAGWAFSSRWALDWLRRQARLSTRPRSPVSILIGDASAGERDADRPAIEAFELFCARAGARVLTLPVRAVSGVADAAGGMHVVVLAGSSAADEEVRRWLGSVRGVAGPLPLLSFRGRERSGGVIGPGPHDAQRVALSVAERAVRPQWGVQKPTTRLSV